MTATATITATAAADFEKQIEAKINAIRRPVQAAMAHMFYDVVVGNLGDSGVDRPTVWPQLSDRSAIGRAYIRKVGRRHATLLETGALQSAIKMDGTQEESGTVSISDSDCHYATRHQFGDPGRGLPSRPYFPIRDGEVTEKTTTLVNEAAREALKELL